MPTLWRRPASPNASRRGRQRSRLAPSRKPPHRSPLAAPSFALAAGIRRLTAVLVVAALLPNLTLAAFWLRAIDMPWSKQAPAAEAGAPASAQVALPPPVLSAPSTLQASAGEHVNFPIALDGTDAVPPNSVIVISGLPPGSRLSTGDRRGGTEWALKPDEIGDLHLVLPTFAVGESKLTIQLVAPGERVVADASTMLSLIPDRDIAEADVTAIPDAAEPQSPDTQAEATRGRCRGRDGIDRCRSGERRCRAGRFGGRAVADQTA